jgi:hypothetical protein
MMMIMIRMIIIQILVATKMRIEFETLEYYVSKLTGNSNLSNYDLSVFHVLSRSKFCEQNFSNLWSKTGDANVATVMLSVYRLKLGQKYLQKTADV